MIASIVCSTSSGSASARKPTWPRLMPSSGVPDSRASSAAAQDRAVAADDHDELAARAARRRRPAPPRPARPRRCRARRRPRRASRTTMPWRVERAAELRGDLDAPSSRPVLHDEQHPPAVAGVSGGCRCGHGSTLSPGDPRVRGAPDLRRDVVRRRSAARRGAARGRTRRCPTGPGSGLVDDRRGHPSPGSRPPRPRAATASARSAEVADHAALADPVLADLELRLDHQRQVARPGRRPRGARRAPARAR